jgi:hypothetical protein
MKLLITLITLLTITSSYASTAFTVSGKLVPNHLPSDVIHMNLLTDAGNFKIVSFDHKIQTCEHGIFEIVNNFHPEDTYSLIEIYDCNNEKEEVVYCPEIYMPICGSLNQESKTFGNFCELSTSGAKFLYAGDCQN